MWVDVQRTVGCPKVLLRPTLDGRAHYKGSTAPCPGTGSSNLTGSSLITPGITSYILTVQTHGSK